MSKIVEYLKIFRAHTTPATFLSVLAYYYLAGGESWSIVALGVFFLGVIFQWCGSGHNTVMDYYYDIQDPHKKHFPLVTGAIKYEEAKKVINWMLLICAFIVVWFILTFAKNKLLSLLCFALYLQSGHSYNDGLNKVSLWKWVPEALCFTFMAGIVWFIGGANINTLFWLVLAHAFLLLMYEIFWEGELKEIEFEQEVNILRFFGAKIYYTDNEKYIHIPTWTQIFGYLIKLSRLIVGFIIVYLVAHPFGTIIYLIGAVIVMNYVIKITRAPRIYDHDKELENMGFAEAFDIVFFALAITASTLQEFVFGITIALGGFIWYLVFNRIQWGVSKRPQV